MTGLDQSTTMLVTEKIPNRNDHIPNKINTSLSNIGLTLLQQNKEQVVSKGIEPSSDSL